MIFVTVGTQLPFDRLIEMVDNAAEGLATEIIAQTGKTKVNPKNIKCFEFLRSHELNSYIEECEVLIGHAGIGTILTAAKLSKPLIMVPRLSKYNEHRNDHQVGTCNAFSNIDGIYVANNYTDIKYIISRKDLKAVSIEASKRRMELLFAIKDFADA